MPINFTLWSLLYALINKSQIFSHVAKRVVDGIGNAAERAANAPVVVVIEELPAPPGIAASDIDPAEWLRIPPPSRFMVYADCMCGTCVVGIFVEGIGVDPPAISWIPIEWDSPVSMELPPNALGALFGVLNSAADALSIRQVDWFGSVDGYEILALRDAFQGSYPGMGFALG